jgi:hypothetical protein
MARTGVDVNLLVATPAEGVAERIEERLAEFEIETAWVTASEARIDEPEAHDERLAHVCDGSRSLRPVPVLVPPTGPRDTYGRAQRIAARATCRVVRLCPTSHQYLLANWVLSPLPELCEREGIALLLDFDPDRVRWVEVVPFARAFPSVPMVVLGVEIGSDRVVPAVLDAAPNLVLQVARIRVVEDLVWLSSTFGSFRFVWGSGGSRDPSAVHASIRGASGLGDESRAAILHGNAEALADGRYAEAFL